MLTVLTYLAAAVALALVTLLVLAARRPDKFAYARSTIIDAPAERIFPLIADPVAFNAWNPFNEDPSISGSYSGPERGPGARYTFGSKKAGTGYTEIVEEQAPRLLVVRLVMTKPIAGDNRVEFRLEPAGEGTRVTWAMSGPVSFTGKVINQVIDCERMCGDQFTRGLAKLKSLAERETQAA
ncbi:MAG: SRPBCC family protein [Hyphomicrobiaceae bacterium]